MYLATSSNQPNLTTAGEMPRWVPFLVIATTMTAVAILLSKWATQTGLQCDELLFLRAIDLGPIEGLTAIGSSHPPLFRWIVGALFDSQSPDWALRLPSIMCALATIVVWYAILRKLFQDSVLVLITLPLVVCNSAWIDIAYQLTPYSCLTLLASLHAWMWLRLIDELNNARVSWMTFLGFVVSGAATFWTHFYGLHLLIADQVIWIVLVIRTRSWWKTWIGTSAWMAMLAAPILPIALHYRAVESGVTILHIEHYPTYFINRSMRLFSQGTFNLDVGGELLILWYAIVAGYVYSWLRSSIRPATGRKPREEVNRQAYIVVLCGFFLASFIAMQAQSLLSQKGMWERYLVFGAWVHWPLLLVVLESRVWPFLPSFSIRRVASMGLVMVVWSLVTVYGLYPKWTLDHRPILATLQSNARPGDAFFAQDKQIWIGPANYERLWLQRYSPVDLTVVTGPVVSFRKLQIDGLDWTAIPSSIHRVWVCSDQFSEKLLRQMQTETWRMTRIYSETSYRPLALFERTTPPVTEDPQTLVLQSSPDFD
jgi:Dolichyl-phosphate-mannose-protein mannosyltransferase